MQFKNSLCLKKLPTRKIPRIRNLEVRPRGHTINVPILYLESDILFHVDRDSDSRDSLIKYGISRQITAEY